MANIKWNFHVEMEDGKTYEVTADQRDLAAWEAHSDGRDWSTHQHSATRFMAWNALSAFRTKQIEMAWEKFDRECVEAGMSVDAEPKSS